LLAISFEGSFYPSTICPGGRGRKKKIGHQGNPKKLPVGKELKKLGNNHPPKKTIISTHPYPEIGTSKGRGWWEKESYTHPQQTYVILREKTMPPETSDLMRRGHREFGPYVCSVLQFM